MYLKKIDKNIINKYFDCIVMGWGYNFLLFKLRR